MYFISHTSMDHLFPFIFNSMVAWCRWGIRLILEALISFLPTPADGAIGALDWTSAERKRLAKSSVNYHCATCGCKALELLPELKPKSDNPEDQGNKKKSLFEKEIAKLQELQSLEHAQLEEEMKQQAGGDEATKTEAKGETPTAPVDKEPALVDETAASSEAKTAATTTPSPVTTTNKDEEPKDIAAAQKPRDANSKEEMTELDRLCQEDPESSRRQLLQGAIPSLRPDKRIALEQRRIRQYYTERLGQTIADGTDSREADNRVNNNNNNNNNNNDEQAQAPAEQQQTRQYVPLEQERLEEPAPPAQERMLQLQQPPQDDVLSWMVDPVLHGIIVTLAILCFLMLRKLQAMMEELDELNQVLEG